MIRVDANARPFITDKPYLKHLADIGVFDKQLDAWAFAVAYALKNDLDTRPASSAGRREDVTEVDHLDKSTLETLLLALENVKPELAQMSSNDVIHQLSMLASAGLAMIRRQTEGRSVNEIYEFLLSQSNSSS